MWGYLSTVEEAHTQGPHTESREASLHIEGGSREVLGRQSRGERGFISVVLVEERAGNLIS